MFNARVKIVRRTEFIVMTAAAFMPASCMGRYGKVAVCEVYAGIKPKMISERAKGMVRIVALKDKLHAGNGGPRTAYAKALADAERLCAALNREARMKRCEALQEARDDDDRRTH